jgi:hypothetical protein
MVKDSNDNEKLQIIYRWKALTEENPLKQFILKMDHCTTLASKGKGFGFRIQLDDLKSDETNWRFRGLCVGLTIQLKRLLA